MDQNDPQWMLIVLKMVKRDPVVLFALVFCKYSIGSNNTFSNHFQRAKIA